MIKYDSTPGGCEWGTPKSVEYAKSMTPGENKKVKKMKEQSVDEGVVKKINKKAKNLQLIMKGREKLGKTDSSKTWQQNRADALKKGRSMREEIVSFSEFTALVEVNMRLKNVEARLKKIKGEDAEMAAFLAGQGDVKQLNKFVLGLNSKNKDLIRKAIEEEIELDEKTFDDKASAIAHVKKHGGKVKPLFKYRDPKTGAKVSTYSVKNEETIDEVLKPAMGAGEYVKDFYKSDAPQFKGKSKEKRQKMAIAAYLAAKRGD